MTQAGINGNKFDNMNPKTLSEPPKWHSKWQSKWHSRGKKWYSRQRNDTHEAKDDTKNSEYDTKNDTKIINSYRWFSRV